MNASVASWDSCLARVLCLRGRAPAGGLLRGTRSLTNLLECCPTMRLLGSHLRCQQLLLQGCHEGFCLCSAL